VPTYGPGSGFINFQRLIDLNQPQARAQANAIHGKLEEPYAGLKEGVDAGQHANFYGEGDKFDWNSLGSRLGQAGLDADWSSYTEGLDALARRQQGNTPHYTSGMSRMDAALMQGAGAQDQFSALREKFRALGTVFAQGRAGKTPGGKHAAPPPDAPPPTAPTDIEIPEGLPNKEERFGYGDGGVQPGTQHPTPVVPLPTAPVATTPLPNTTTAPTPMPTTPPINPTPSPTPTDGGFFERYKKSRLNTKLDPIAGGGSSTFGYY
jgi:hypothetical protein